MCQEVFRKDALPAFVPDTNLSMAGPPGYQTWTETSNASHDGLSQKFSGELAEYFQR